MIGGWALSVRTRSLAAALMFGLAATSLVACGANSTTASNDGGPATQDPRLTQPLPGTDGAKVVIGVITAQLTNLQLNLGPPLGITDAQITALTSSLANVGGKLVRIEQTAVIGGLGQAFDETRECAAQKGSTVVITDVGDRALVDCLVGNGSLVIDASGQMWDSQGLAERAPFVWATATAAADLAEKALIAQAFPTPAPSGATAIVVAGPDAVSKRVANDVTIPGLAAAGLTPTLRTITGSSATFADLTTPTEELTKVTGTVLRPLTPALFSVIATTEDPTKGFSSVLLTSNDRPGVITDTGQDTAASDVGPKTTLLGWSPVSDGTKTSGTVAGTSRPGDSSTGTPDDSIRCRAQLGAANTPGDLAPSWPSLYRLCDAIDLVARGLAPPGTPTPSTFSNAVWSWNPPATPAACPGPDPCVVASVWNPIAVRASGWLPNTYAGANLAQKLIWDAKCTPATTGTQTGCFTPTSPLLPLKN